MIQVITRTTDGEIKPVEFNSRAIEVLDGALVIYDTDANYFTAGFAPGQWLTFQYLD